MIRRIVQKISWFLKQCRPYLKWSSSLLLLLFILWYCCCLPDKLFSSGSATVLLDRNGALLGARIAADGQWRFEAGDSIPVKFETCILQFEDRNFYEHYGVSIRGMGRAIVQNVEQGRIVSGGSTISMQLARLIRKNPKRTIVEKCIEICMATRLEMRYSKREILSYYAAHAPFGNNVVGLEAASWRYFGRGPETLSWAESSTLAVLPNAPGLIYPGKNHERLLQKRNRLLKRLFDIHKIDEVTYKLALTEPLPDKPLPLPQLAPHLMSRTLKEGMQGQTVCSTIDIRLQEQAVALVQQYSLQLQDNKIYNAAVLISSVKTGEVLAYVGNTRSDDPESGSQVDCITAARSTGSILKPFLYEKALEEGLVNPKTLLPDVPTHYGSFSPKNFSLQYDGAVPADQALSRSLNIPFVNLLNQYGLEKYHYELRKMGLTTLGKPATHYGLSLILGGAEAKLWDLNQAYLSMAQQLGFQKVKALVFVKGQAVAGTGKTMNPACIYATFEAMKEVNRPDEEGNWRAFTGSQEIAWKTGTSFGFRDAWAIGITPDYVVSVWVGNADGEGRPGITGIKAAAPLMFSVFSRLPKPAHWFGKPYRYLKQMKICRASGYRAGDLCTEYYYADVPESCLQTTSCIYHQLVHLSKDGRYRVDSDCEDPYKILHTPWFVLPPIVEKYYRYKHPDYKRLPEFKPECLTKLSDRAIGILYPRPGSRIYVPFEIDGSAGKTVFEATHRNTAIKLYWHLDEAYLGETREIHQMALNPEPGKHVLLLMDENGISQKVNFEVLGKTVNN